MRFSTSTKILIVWLAVCLTATGVWAFRRAKDAPVRTKPVGANTTLSAFSVRKGDTATDKEIEKWSARVRQNERDDKAWVALGDALMQKARETSDAANYSAAEKTYTKALELNPKSVEATTGLAWVNGGRHEFEKSIEWANKAIALDPKNNAAYGLLGDADIEMGNYELAMDHCQKMLDLRPDISSYSRGAHLLYLLGDTKRAAALMSQAVNTGAPFAENTAWCRAQLALILYSDGMLMPAERILTYGLKQSPNNYHLLAAMGKVKAARKDYPAAIDSYKKAIAIAPQHEALVALGDLYALTSNKTEAEKQYALVETIHKINKANGVRGDMQIAQFYADHDINLPEALQEAEAEYPTRKNVFAADTLAWCYYKNGRYKQAAETIRYALSKKTPEARLHYHAGMIFAKLNLHESAMQELNAALSINPEFSPRDAPAAAAMIAQLGGGTRSEDTIALPKVKTN